MDKILTQGGKIEGEKRPVTIMFVDMVGFTSLAERLGAEATFLLMDKVYGVLIQKINEFGGSVLELRGDGVLAVFGAPVALEDATDRALYAALAIHGQVAAFAERHEAELGGATLVMRIGIHGGPVVIGALGNAARVQFAAVGDTINLAARLEQLAAPGTTCVSQTIYDKGRDIFHFEPLGPRQVKGKTALVNAYRLVGASAHQTRFQARSHQGLTAFVGRQKPLADLAGALAEMKTGLVRAVSIVSQAGMGKTRLLHHWRLGQASQAGEGVFLESKCLAFRNNTAYQPIAEVLRQYCGITGQDTSAAAAARARAALAGLDLDGQNLEILLEVLNASGAARQPPASSQEEQQHRILNCLQAVLVAIARRRPLIVVIEDIHWTDNGTRQCLDHLIRHSRDARLLLIVTSRLPFTLAWAGLPHHRLIVLDRLSNRQSLELARNLLGPGRLARELSRCILEKTLGNPLFIEEFIASLRQLKLIAPASRGFCITGDVSGADIPATIHDVVMARVDALPEQTKALLHIGALIQGRFDYELLRSVSQLSGRQLCFHLALLKKADMIHEHGAPPRAVYAIKHALIRDVIHGAMLEAKKQKLHRRIARVLELQVKGGPDAFCGELAYHFLQGGDYARAAHYAKAAGAHAERAAALDDAAENAGKMVWALERLSQTSPCPEKIVEARVAMALYQFQRGRFIDAVASIEPVRGLIENAAPTASQALAFVFLGCYYYMAKEEFTLAIDYLKKATEVGRTVGDVMSFGFSHYFTGLILAMHCRFKQAHTYLAELLAMVLAIQSPWRASAMQSNLSAYAYTYHGNVAEGHQLSASALEQAEQSGDIFSKAMAYTHHGTSCYYRGLLAEAEKWLTKAVALADRIDMTSHSPLAHQWLGHVYIDQGRPRPAKVHFAQAVRIREQSGLFPSSAHLNRIALTMARTFGGEKRINIDALLGWAAATRVPLYRGWVARHTAQVLLNLDPPRLDAAEHWLEQAVAAHKTDEMSWDLGRDHLVYSQFYQRRGKKAACVSHLQTALTIFQDCGATGWVRRTHDRLQAIGRRLPP